MRGHRPWGGGGLDRPQGGGGGRTPRRDLADPRPHRSRRRRPSAQGRHRSARLPPPRRPDALRSCAGPGGGLRPAGRPAARARSDPRARRCVAGGRARVPGATRPRSLAGKRRVRRTGRRVQRGRAVPGLDRTDRPARRRLRDADAQHRARVAYAARFDHRVLRAWTGNHRGTRAPSQPLPHRRPSARLERRDRPACVAGSKSGPGRGAAGTRAPTAASIIRWATVPTEPGGMINHLLALALLGVDCVVRAWRIQLVTWTAGGRLSFGDAFRLNLYGEAASQLTPNRLGGEPARFLGLTEAGLRPVTGIVAIGVEVACEWPVFLLAGAALFAYYVPDWRDAARTWLHRHRAGELVTVEIIALIVLVTVYLLQRLARAGFIRHRVRRQWRVAWAHVRRAPRWALGAGALLTVASLAARALILPALAWGVPGGPPFAEMFYGALALLHAPLVVPLPSGGGGLEVAFLNGFAGDFGVRQVTMLLLWRFYTAVLLTVLGVYALVRSIGYRASVEVFKIGWGKRREVQ